MPGSWLESTVPGSWLVPGIALLVVVAVPMHTAAFLLVATALRLRPGRQLSPRWRGRAPTTASRLAETSR